MSSPRASGTAPPPPTPPHAPPSSATPEGTASDPSAVLTISPWNSTAVATAELFEHAGVHDAVAALAEELLADLRRIDALVPESALITADTHHGVLAEREIERAVLELSRTVLVCRTLAGALRAAADGYGIAEQASAQSWTWFTDLVGYGAGTLARITLPAWILPVLGLAAGAALTKAVGLDDEVGELWSTIGLNANGLYTGEGVVDGLRSVAMGSDDFIAGFLGIPLPVQQALGDSGLGIAGLASSAAMLRGATSLFGTPESVPMVRTGRAEPGAVPPESIVSLAERIPRTDENGGDQIVIERYTMPDGSTHAVVLLAGTAEFTIGSDEPWDMGGNFSAVAGVESSASLAVHEAMRQAGLDAATPIQLVGFSQGGAQAAVLAMSGEYNVHSVITFGAPIGQLELPASIPVLAVRHPDDLVASGGGGNELHLPNVFEVTNVAFAGQPVPTDLPAPAHQFDSYLRTAGLMDADGSPELRGAIDSMLGFAAGAVDGTTTSYHAVRGDD